MLSAEDLATVSALDPECVDVVVLPYGPAFPAAARKPFQRFLRRGPAEKDGAQAAVFAHHLFRGRIPIHNSKIGIPFNISQRCMLYVKGQFLL